MNQFDLIAKLQVQAPNLGPVVADMTRQMSGVRTSLQITGVREASQQIAALNSNIQRTANTLSQLQSMRAAASIREVGTASQTASKGLDAFGRSARALGTVALAAPVYGFAQAIRSGISQAVEFERTINKVGTVTGATVPQLRAMGAEISRLSQTFGVSSKQLSNAAFQFTTAGISLKDTSKILETISLVGLAPDAASLDKSASAAIALSKAFKLSAGELRSALGGAASIAADSATTFDELMESVKRVGGVFSATGGNVNQLFSVFASAKGTTQQSAAVTSTAMKALFSRLQRDDVVQGLKSIGVQLRITKSDIENAGLDKALLGQMKNPFDSVQQIGAALSKIRPTDVRYANLTELLGGSRNLATTLAITKETAEQRRLMNVAMAGEIQLVSSAERAQGTLSNSLSRLQEQYLSLTRSLVDSQGFQSAAKAALSLASSIGKVAESLGPILPLLAAVGTARLATGIGRSLSGIPRFATGGKVPGNPAEGDSQLTLLQGGEYVIREPIARKVGYSNLARLNRLATRAGITPNISPYVDLNIEGHIPHDPNGLLNAAGVLPGSSVSVRGRHDALTVRSSGEWGRSRRAVFFDSRGNLAHVENEEFEAAKHGAGAATHSYARQVLYGNAPKIIVHAAGDPSTLNHGRSGYYVWPTKFGVNGSVPIETISSMLGDKVLPDHLRRGKISVQDILALPGGEALWRDYGGAFTGTLDPKNPRVLNAISKRLIKQLRIGHFATGGPTPPLLNSGSPALLTGGEFVFDREAASRIGSTALNALNQTGSLRRFADGGPVGSGFSDRAYRRTPDQIKQEVDQLALRQSVLDQISRAKTPAQAQVALVDARDSGLSGMGYRVAEATYKRNWGEPYSVFQAHFGSRPGENQAGFSTSFARVAQQTTASAIGLRGGPGALSEATKDELAAKAALTTRQELIRAQQRLVKALTPGVSAAESWKIATEQADHALMGQAKIVRAANGNVIGLQSSVVAAQQAGLDPTQIVRGGRFARFTGSVRGLAGRYMSARERWAERQTAGSQMGLFLGATAASYTAAGLDSMAGSPESAGGSYRGLRGASGLLSGSANGALLGSALGPYGAIAGASLGGALGLHNSLSAATEELREARINSARSGLNDSLSVMAGGGSVSLESLRSDLSTVLKETSAKNRETSTSHFGNLDTSKYADLQGRSRREIFASQLPAIGQILSRDAQEIARANPGKAAKDLTGQLIAGGTGLNKQLLELTAQVRGVPLPTVLREFTKDIHATQQSEIASKQGRLAGESEARQVNGFSRLVSSFQAASDAQHRANGNTIGITDLFNSNVSAPHFSANAHKLDQLGRLDGAALEPLNLVARFGGEASASLLSSGKAADQLSRILPDVLGNVASQRPAEGMDFVTAVEDQLRTKLGPNLSPELRSGMSSVIGGLSKSDDVGEMISAVKVDASKFAEKLLSPFVDPIREAGTKAASILEQSANQYAEGAADLIRQRQVIGEGRDRAGFLQLGAVRQAAEFEGERTFSRRSVLDSLSLSTLNAPLQSRQERLTGLSGIEANDPAAIARRLSEVQRQTMDATAAHQSSLSGPPEAIQEASQKLLDLKDKAANLSGALRHLTDTSERNAAALDKLRSLDSDRVSRLSLAERFATADPREASLLRRGFGLASQANANPAFFTAMSASNRRLTVDALRSAGDAELPGFGGKRASDVLEKLLSNFGGGVFRPTPEKQQEADSLRQSIEDNNKKSLEAQTKLVASQERLSADFFSSLKQQQGEFFARLGEMLGRDKVVSLKNRQGTVSAELGELRGLAGNRDLLSRVGVKGDSDLGKLRSGLGDIDRLASVRGELSTILDQRREATKNENLNRVFDSAYGDITSGVSKGDRFSGGIEVNAKRSSAITDALNGLPGAEKVPTYLAEELARSRRPPEISAATLPQYRQAFSGALKNAILRASTEQYSALEQGRLSEARGKVKAAGLDVGGVEAIINEGKLEQVRKAVDSFATTSQSLSGLDKRIRDTEAEFAGLEKQLATLNATLATKPGPVGSPAKPLALGGPVFKAMGTDTVPAMLTPGEFIVRSGAAKANLPLLNSINQGAIYAATGGQVLRRKLAAVPSVTRAVEAVLVDPKQLRQRKMIDAQTAKQDAARKAFAKVHRDAVNKYDADAAIRLENFQKVHNKAVAKQDAEADARRQAFRDHLAKVMPKAKPVFAPKFDPKVMAREIARRHARRSRRGSVPNPVLAQLQHEAITNPFGASAAVLNGGNPFAMHAAEIANFRRRQTAANAFDPGAAFGMGRADFGGQNFALQASLQRQHDANTVNAMEYRNRFAPFVRPQFFRFASGGIVPGSGDSDSVPALLTPGEAVLNKAAVNRMGATNVSRANGGDSSLANSGQGTAALNQALTAFGGHATALAEAINNMPRNLAITGQLQAHVAITGADALAKLGAVTKDWVTSEIDNAIRKTFKQYLPDAGAHL